YDERARAGELRYVVVRRNADGELLVVCVAATAGERARLARAARSLRAEAPAVHGVVLHVNDASSAAIFRAGGPAHLILDRRGAAAPPTSSSTGSARSASGSATCASVCRRAPSSRSTVSRRRGSTPRPRRPPAPRPAGTSSTSTPGRAASRSPRRSAAPTSSAS